MSADVHQVELWQAYCHECRWYGDQMDGPNAADRQADEHDDEFHEETPR